MLNADKLAAATDDSGQCFISCRHEAFKKVVYQYMYSLAVIVFTVYKAVQAIKVWSSGGIILDIINFFAMLLIYILWGGAFILLGLSLRLTVISLTLYKFFPDIENYVGDCDCLSEPEDKDRTSMQCCVKTSSQGRYYCHCGRAVVKEIQSAQII